MLLLFKEGNYDDADDDTGKTNFLIKLQCHQQWLHSRTHTQTHTGTHTLNVFIFLVLREVEKITQRKYNFYFTHPLRSYIIMANVPLQWHLDHESGHGWSVITCT